MLLAICCGIVQQVLHAQPGLFLHHHGSLLVFLRQLWRQTRFRQRPSFDSIHAGSIWFVGNLVWWFVGSICACVLRHLIWWRKNKSRYHSLHVSEQSWRQWRKEESSYHPWLSRLKVQKFRRATPTRLPWHLRSCRLGRRQACQNHAVAIGVHGGDERSSDVGTHLVPSSQAEQRSASSSNLLSLLGVALLGGAWTRTAGCRRLRTWSWVEREVSVAQQMVGPS